MSTVATSGAAGFGLQGGRLLPERGAGAPPIRRTSADLPHESLTPRPAVWKERLMHVLAVLTVVYGLYYVGWRWTSTLNPAALWIAVPLAAAETLALLTLVLFIVDAWRLQERSSPRAPAGLSVDVFVTTYDEPLDVIRQTVLGARAIWYPHNTYVLDDGRREELAHMATELGVGYITRADNEHAKAGNLNNALRRTTGDFILQLDADHVPLPHILDRMLGYMQDPRVAFVQSPQNFYNTDAYSTHLSEDSLQYHNDQDVFFSVIQPGKDRLNAAFFCGSCAVLRRAAIDELCGFSTYTITEDVETSVRLHARGWKSVYHNEALAYGLAPRTARAFHVQRLRWARGSMQLLRRFNPLTLPGLSGWQRVSYVSSLLHPVAGPTRLVFLIAPLAYLLLGTYPVQSFGVEFLVHFLPYVFLLVILNRLLARGRAGPLWYQEFAATTRIFAHTLAPLAFFTTRRMRFQVTPKGEDRGGWRTQVPFGVLLVLTVVALAVGTQRAVADMLRYGLEESDGIAYLVNVSWALWNGAILALVVRSGLRSVQRRPTQRFDEFLPFHLAILGADGDAGAAIPAITENLNGKGLAFRSLAAVAVGTRVQLELPLVTGPVSVRGTVIHARQDAAPDGGLHRHGVRFDDMAPASRDAIDVHCTQHAVPGSRFRFVRSAGLFPERFRGSRDGRGDDRRSVLLPVEIHCPAHPMVGRELAVLESASRQGARLLLTFALQLDDPLTYRVPGRDQLVAGRVRHCTPIRTPLGNRYMIGLRTTGTIVRASRNGRKGLTRMKKVAMLAGLLTAFKRFVVVVALSAAGLSVAAAPSRAQVGTGYLAGAEAADDGQSLVLIGGWLNAARGPLMPIVGVIGYRLEHPAAAGSIEVWTANPFVGVRRQWNATGLQINAGYAFQSGEDPAGDGARRISKGPTTSLQVDHGGRDATAAQALASYSWGDERYLWSRLRGSTRIGGAGSGMIRMGAEATGQGGGGYRAYEVGPLVEWLSGSGFSVLAGGGYRRAVPEAGSASATAFVRLELLVLR